MSDTRDLDTELRHAQAINRIATVVTRGDAASIRDAMVAIIGETLDVDRTLIYDVRFDDGLAEGLCEWLNPAAEGITPTIATYPIEVFIGGATVAHQTETWLESHHDAPHEAFLGDGSAEVLHGQMDIKSLLWFPFDIEPNRFFALVFNQVRSKRVWSASDLAFVAQMAELVSMAHLRMRLDSRRQLEREDAERRARLEGLGLLAGGVAHDFNNLLTAILGNAALADRARGDGTMVARHLGAIQRAATTAADMCRQLLTYAGRANATPTLLDVAALARETGELLDHERRGRLELVLPADHVWVKGDRLQLQQVLLNLVTNAFDASPADAKVTLRAGRYEGGVPGAYGVQDDAARAWDGGVFVRVEDAGHGMDPETVSRMFEPFFTTKDDGHGLGLAAVHGVLSSHDAAIGVQSATGEGTAIAIVFQAVDPASPAASQPPPRAVPTKTLEPPPQSGARRRVLVVDDERMVRSVCESTLALHGFKPLTAATGEDALAIFELEGPFDGIVLDIDLPGIDGRETFGRLRQAGCRAPIVLISAYPLGDGFAHASDPRWTFLQKPFGPDELVAMLSGLFRAASA